MMLPRVQKFIKKIELDSSQSKILFLKKQKTLEQNFKKKLHGLFLWMGFNYLKATELL